MSSARTTICCNAVALIIANSTACGARLHDARGASQSPSRTSKRDRTPLSFFPLKAVWTLSLNAQLAVDAAPAFDGGRALRRQRHFVSDVRAVPLRQQRHRQSIDRVQAPQRLRGDPRASLLRAPHAPRPVVRRLQSASRCARGTPRTGDSAAALASTNMVSIGGGSQAGVAQWESTGPTNRVVAGSSPAMGTQALMWREALPVKQ